MDKNWTRQLNNDVKDEVIVIGTLFYILNIFYGAVKVIYGAVKVTHNRNRLIVMGGRGVGFREVPPPWILLSETSEIMGEKGNMTYVYTYLIFMCTLFHKHVTFGKYFHFNLSLSPSPFWKITE